MHEHVVVESEQLQRLIDVLQERGYQVVGPTVRDKAIVYEQIDSIKNLPVGWTDQQDGGRYQLVKRDDQAWFGYTVGPHSWRKFLHPSALRLWQAQRREDGFEFLDDPQDIPKYAFLGVRACELHAIAIQDRVFLHGPHIDAGYASRRQDVFTIAVNCGQAGGTCFCVSMQTGPQATSGFDLALTEILNGDQHYFVVDIGTDLGAEIMHDVPHRNAETDDLQIAAHVTAQTAAQMGRHLETEGIQELLYHNIEHPRWEDVAQRCLSCSNCTLVCPTCFCTTVEDVTDLTGSQAERWRKWDSCFTQDFSYLHGGSVRTSTRSRYRHWLTHKLATWLDQFGTSGCVGCGRCITWCPVGIDITEEVRAIRESTPQDPSHMQELPNANA
ncbi:MAG: 4Fe-4S ferredoxin [Candidatus Entotheonella factor]|uniref:4Fe-4S ferredoxin n=1 Tax=Entotheonella factor TaxID=1429438 RepID=W4L9P3_ENTF1|nr:4Fe-4S dicluster domain-containing protein [Candidatus Entotheonella palauensis]ETW94061.1 MAG: 4Fe-4S ferredoxin [Candidatus Entotheonella factor]